MNGLRSVDLYNEKLKSGIMEQDDIWSVVEFLNVYLGKEVRDHVENLVIDKMRECSDR